MLSAYGLMHIKSVLAFQCLECPSPSLFKEANTDSVMSIQDTFPYVTTGRQLVGGDGGSGETRKQKCL